MSSKFFLTAIVAVAAAWFAPSKGQAAFKVSVSVFGYDGVGNIANASSYTVLQGSSQTFADPNEGTLLSGDFSVRLDNFLSASSTPSGPLATGLDLRFNAVSNRDEVGANPAQLTEQATRVQNRTGTAYLIVITTTNTGYTIPVGADSMKLTSTVGWSTPGNPSVSGSFQSWVDTANSEYGQSSAAPVQALGSGLIDTKSIQFTRSGPYSITNQFSILTSGSMTAAAALTGTSEVYSAPAPAGLIMAATALPFFGLLRRRLRKSEVANAA